MCRFARGVGQHFELVELLVRLLAGRRDRRRRTPARPPRPAATSPRLPLGRTCPNLPPETKKPLEREAWGTRRGAAALFPAYSRSCFIATDFSIVSSIRGGRMAGYTKLNLKDDVEDQAPNSGCRRRARVPHGAGPARARELRRQLPGPGAELPGSLRAPPQHPGRGLRPGQRQREAEARRRGDRAEAVRRGPVHKGTMREPRRRAEGRGGRPVRRAQRRAR